MFLVYLFGFGWGWIVSPVLWSNAFGGRLYGYRLVGWGGVIVWYGWGVAVLSLFVWVSSYVVFYFFFLFWFLVCDCAWNFTSGFPAVVQDFF